MKPRIYKGPTREQIIDMCKTFRLGRKQLAEICRVSEITVRRWESRGRTANAMPRSAWELFLLKMLPKVRSREEAAIMRKNLAEADLDYRC